jgi:hypothetical protein
MNLLILINKIKNCCKTSAARKQLVKYQGRQVKNNVSFYSGKKTLPGFQG